MVRFNIDSGSPVPPYQQVKQSITLEVLSGRLTDGDRLPSIRELAKLLKLNPNTVARAYYSLEEDGMLEGRRGSGYLVKLQKTKIDKLRLGMLEDEFKVFLQKAFSMGFSKKDVEEMMRRLLNNE